MVKFLQDAKPEVRSVARICFVRYKQIVTQNKWLKLQRSLSASNQRVLEELDEAALVEEIAEFRAFEALKSTWHVSEQFE